MTDDDVMRWFMPRRNNRVFIRLVLSAIIVAGLSIWAFTERSRAQNLQSQLSVIEQKIERNPLLAPPTTVKAEDIGMLGDGLTIKLGKDVRIFKTSGESMLPIVSNGGKIAALPVRSVEEIIVGSFVISTVLGVLPLVGHQIVEIGQDSQGWYAQTKGTGNFERDLFKLRASDIKYRVVLVIY